jgi:acetyl/propionyl-CoA carboxylase alpha subunit
LVENNSEVVEGQEIVNLTSETGKLEKVLEAPVSGKISIKLEEDLMVGCGTLIGTIE